METAKVFMMGIISEVAELMGCLKWKDHRKDPPWMPAVLRPRVLEEMVDVFKYWDSVRIAFDFSWDEFHEAWWRKSMICQQRYCEEHVGDLEGPIIVLDLDGPVCDWRTCFLGWLEDAHPHVYTPELWNLRQPVNSVTLGVTEDQWSRIKFEFRMSGAKGRAPIVPGAQEQIQNWLRRDINVVILTARPIHECKDLLSQTFFWLKERDITPTFFWWTRNELKGSIISKAGLADRVLMAFDDDPEQCRNLHNHGVPVTQILTESWPETDSNPDWPVARSISEVDIDA